MSIFNAIRAVRSVWVEDSLYQPTTTAVIPTPAASQIGSKTLFQRIAEKAGLYLNALSKPPLPYGGYGSVSGGDPGNGRRTAITIAAVVGLLLILKKR